MRPFRKLSRWVDWVFKDTLLDGRQNAQTAQSARSTITTTHLKPKAVLTYQERAFFWVLVRAMAAEYSVLAKVHVGNLIEMSDELKSQKTYGEQIQSEHVDFLLCKKNTFEPILVIELDNGAHDPERAKSDQVRVEMLVAAGIAFLHIPIQKNTTVLISNSKSMKSLGRHQSLQPAIIGMADSFR